MDDYTKTPDGVVIPPAKTEVGDAFGGRNPRIEPRGLDEKSGPPALVVHALTASKRNRLREEFPGGVTYFRPVAGKGASPIHVAGAGYLTLGIAETLIRGLAGALHLAKLDREREEARAELERGLLDGTAARVTPERHGG